MAATETNQATTINSNEITVIPTTQEIIVQTEKVTTEPTTTESSTTETTIASEQCSTQKEIIIDEEMKAETPITDYSDLDLLARTIYQEAGTCSEHCQWLVGSTVMNLADEYGGIENVVFDYNTFNVAYSLYDTEPAEISYLVAHRILSGDRDYTVKAFRNSYYHDFGTPYTNVDNVYFSTY